MVFTAILQIKDDPSIANNILGIPPKDWLYIIVAVLSLLFNIFQYIRNRKYVKSDKLRDKRIDAYKMYLNKFEEISKAVKYDSNSIFSPLNEYIQKVSAETDMNDEAFRIQLHSLKDGMIENINNAQRAPMIILNELNDLELFASRKILNKISEYKVLAEELDREMFKQLKEFKIKNFMEIQDFYDNTINTVDSFNYNERQKRLQRINSEILELMRNEIGSN